MNYDNKVEIIKEKYFPSQIKFNDGSYINMQKKERDYYLSILNECPFLTINDYSIVQMKLTRSNSLVDFNGMMTNGEYNVTLNGVIDFQKEIVDANIHWTNDDNYEKQKIKFSEIKQKGRKR